MPKSSFEIEIAKLCETPLTITVYGPVQASYTAGRIGIPAFAAWSWAKDGVTKKYPPEAFERFYLTPIPRERIRLHQVCTMSQNNPAKELLDLSSSTDTTFNPSMIEA